MPPSAITLRQDAQQYLVIAPDGNQIQISRELFGALWERARREDELLAA